MHAMCVGFSPRYLEENRDGIRQGWPRIPLPKTREALEDSAGLGEQVTSLLDTEKEVSTVTMGSIRPELQIIAAVAKEGGGQLQQGDLELTVGWGHRGQNDVVMPGKGKMVQRDYTEEERVAMRQGAGSLGLSLEGVLTRLGDQTFDVYLNGAAYWRNVPKGVWEYVVGGYQVLKKWLSYREDAVLGRSLTVDEVREFTNMARRLAAILLLQPALDENYARCKGDSYPWPDP